MSVSDALSLLNRVALITGANNPSSIGAAVARELARAGARVAITYQRIAEAPGNSGGEPGRIFYTEQKSQSADELVATIRSSGGTAVTLEADLRVSGTPRHLFDWAERELGPVEILVNCAAHCESHDDSILTITPDAIAQTFSVNVQAAILLMHEFASRFKRHKGRYGRVINFSTDAARSFPGQISYGASKAAIESLTRSIARELGPLGITVNTVAPGPVQTGYISDEVSQQLSADIPLGRIGMPQDIVSAVNYFLRPDAEWITGQVLRVAGGHDI